MSECMRSIIPTQKGMSVLR